MPKKRCHYQHKLEMTNQKLIRHKVQCTLHCKIKSVGEERSDKEGEIK
jgi:hypothetical protein